MSSLAVLQSLSSQKLQLDCLLVCPPWPGLGWPVLGKLSICIPLCDIWPQCNAGIMSPAQHHLEFSSIKTDNKPCQAKQSKQNIYTATHSAQIFEELLFIELFYRPQSMVDRKRNWDNMSIVNDTNILQINIWNNDLLSTFLLQRSS